MVAKIGILGESTVTTVPTTTTLYTVPADKAARVRFLIAVEGGGGNHEIIFKCGSPGEEPAFNSSAGSGIDTWSGIHAKATPDPALSRTLNDIGMQEFSGGFDLSTFHANTYVIAPLPLDYFLSTGDTVRLTLESTAAADLLSQVHGVEDDA